MSVRDSLASILRQRRSLLAGIVLGAVGVAVLGAVVLPPWLLAHRSDLPGELRIGHLAVSLAARLNAGTQSSPIQSADRGTLQRGQYAYAGSCAQCHGPTGDGTHGALSSALFPPATDLTSGDAMEKSDAELFWMTKQGLSFTAMPGFADQYNDQTIWAIVAYLRTLQHGRSTALVVPTPTDQQLARADIGGDPVARGAAVYFAQGCQLCHGGSGDGPGELRLRSISTSDAALQCAMRNGPNGMPAYDAAHLTDAQLADLIAFLRTLAPPEPARAARPTPNGSSGPPSRPEGGGERQAYSSAAAAVAGFAGC